MDPAAKTPRRHGTGRQAAPALPLPLTRAGVAVLARIGRALNSLPLIALDPCSVEPRPSLPCRPGRWAIRAGDCGSARLRAVKGRDTNFAPLRFTPTAVGQVVSEWKND